MFSQRITYGYKNIVVMLFQLCNTVNHIRENMGVEQMMKLITPDCRSNVFGLGVKMVQLAKNLETSFSDINCRESFW